MSITKIIEFPVDRYNPLSSGLIVQQAVRPFRVLLLRQKHPFASVCCLKGVVENPRQVSCFYIKNKRDFLVRLFMQTLRW